MIVGVTAIADGSALIVDSLLVRGGLHLVVFGFVLRRHDRWVCAGPVAAFDALIWIFEQTVFIPFNFLQAFYFARSNTIRCIAVRRVEGLWCGSRRWGWSR